MSTTIHNIHKETGAGWEILAQSGYSGEVKDDIAFIHNGGVNLMPPEREVLAQLDSLDQWCECAIHLQCSGGKDLLSLWNLGAKRLIGVDISETLLGYAAQKSAALNAPATWHCCDILDAPAELDGTADLVYTGKGALPWMVDIDAWAAVVARLLKSGGYFFVFEGHPMTNLWSRDVDSLQIRTDGASYFPNEAVENPGFPASRLTRVLGEQTNRPQMVERMWRPSEVLNALTNAGLHYVHFEEYPLLFWDQFDMPKTLSDRLPNTYSILMQK
ncbi:MAG: class I SAM-dependent methyltransferase [Chloroflexota bacterium]